RPAATRVRRRSIVVAPAIRAMRSVDDGGGDGIQVGTGCRVVGARVGHAAVDRMHLVGTVTGGRQRIGAHRVAPYRAARGVLVQLVGHEVVRGDGAVGVLHAAGVHVVRGGRVEAGIKRDVVGRERRAAGGDAALGVDVGGGIAGHAAE